MGMLKIVGVALLLALGAATALVVDAGWNGGHLLATLLGRDRLVTACLPALQAKLVERGFAPTDVEVGEPASLTVAMGMFGRSRTLSGPFTFSDGPNGPREDGRLVCRVRGTAVEVEVDVDGLPVRAA